MRKSKFSEAQIASAVKQVELGLPIEEVCRKIGISQNTFYVWRRRFGSMEPSEIRRLRQLEGENRRLKGMVADLSLDKQMLQEVRPLARRERNARPREDGQPANPLQPGRRGEEPRGGRRGGGVPERDEGRAQGVHA